MQPAVYRNLNQEVAALFKHIGKTQHNYCSLRPNLSWCQGKNTITDALNIMKI